MRDFDWQIISTLYRYGSITKASEVLFLAQPTLTKRIKAIEDDLGITLVTRSPRGIAFTEAGRYAAHQAQKILELIDETRSQIRESGQHTQTKLRICAPRSIQLHTLPELIAQFSMIHPEIQPEIHTALSSDIVRQLERGDMDVGFIRGVHPTSLEKIQLYSSLLYIVNSEPIDLQALPDMDQIAFVQDPTIEKAVDDWWKEHFDHGPRIRMRVSSAEACLAMVRQGLGYGIVSDGNYFKDLPNIYARPMVNRDGSNFIRKAYLAYPREALQNTAASCFIEFIKGYPFQDEANREA